MTQTPPHALVDIGANLSHSAFHHDLPQVVEAARAAGVAHIIVTGTDIDSIEAGLTLVERYEGYMTLTAGFHPHVASQFDAAAAARVRTFLQLPRVVAVGECGLDFNRDFSPRDRQLEVFAQHLELAADCQKPLFLHQRDAHNSFIAILREYRQRVSGGVVHCFTDERQALFDYLDQDMYIGITGWICDERRGRHLQELVAAIPADRLLLETDAPYLLPRSLKPPPPHRRNEPRFLPEVLNTVARCCGRHPQQVAEESSRNAVRLFNLEDVTGVAATTG